MTNDAGDSASSPAQAERSALTIASGLQLEHFRIEPAVLHELIVLSLLRNSTLLQHENAVRHADRGEPVRDQQRHLALCEFRETLEHFV